MSSITALVTPPRPSTHQRYDSNSSARSLQRPRVQPNSDLDRQNTQKSSHPSIADNDQPKTNARGSLVLVEQDDMEDPHDLSFSSNLPPRASMVENMALALDQFSSGMFDVTPPRHTPRSNSYDQRVGRVRGHTVTSSTSSDGDIRDLRSMLAPQIASSRTVKRDSDKYQKNLNKLPSIFGEDEDSVRAKVYDAQRAGPSRPKVRRPTKGSANSATSSIDLGHLAAYQGRLGHAGDRRSRSFDFGSHQRPARFNLSDDMGIAPTPVIAPGPEAQKSPNKPTLAPPVARKNSARSSKSAATRKPRAGTLGTATVKSKTPDALPPMPVRPGQFQVVTDARASPHDTSLGPRPGFFRRVFGSSKPASHNEIAQTSSARTSLDLNAPQSLSQRPEPLSTESSANKENQPALQKKTSSFFRRRKRSINNPAPPPMPLTLSSNGVAPRHGHQDSPESAKKTGSSGETFYTPGLGSPTVDEDDMKTPTKASHVLRNTAAPASKPNGFLRPHHDSFLADSSGSEGNPSPYLLQNNNNSQLSNSSSNRLTASAKNQSSNSVTAIRRVDTTGTQASASSLAGESASESLRQISSDKLNGTSEVRRTVSNTSAPLAASPISDYRSAPSTPVPIELGGPGPEVHVSRPSISSNPQEAARVKAEKIYNNVDDDLGQDAAAAWLGDAGPEREVVRTAFMDLFDFKHCNILASLRKLCDRIVLRGETQQMDRLLFAFSHRWCACNDTHGFKSLDVVHTICYSILLLNTDLHLADIGSKMTKGQFVRNALPTIRHVAGERKDLAPGDLQRSNTDDDGRSASVDHDQTVRLTKRPVDKLTREDSGDVDASVVGGALVDAPYKGSERGWDAQIEAVLRTFYVSISQQPLPLFGSEVEAVPAQSNNNLLNLGSSMLRRTPSTISKAHSDLSRPRMGPESKSLGARWAAKARSRPRLPSAPGFGSSRTSLDEQSSAWSPSVSSTWRLSVLDRFANALSQAIIREDQFELNSDDGGMKTGPLLEDESLELCGAPWAKEGILKHKCHLEGVDKRSKDRNWNDCFAVIERGWMRLFSFSSTAKTLRSKAGKQKSNGVVGGGNWQDNAEEVWKFMLRHAIASALPPPGYSKSRPYVWALSLPTGAVHLFSVGTPDIVKEFVSTANFWSARLSKEPMVGGVSNMEYGWSDNVVNRALIPTSDSTKSMSISGSRPSTQLSMRSSIDHHGTVRARMAGDRAYINEWNPPQQSMFASQLLEVDQLRALQAYVHSVEEELQKHNELRGAMQLAYSPKHINAGKAMNNWERKSSYLLREIVKFRTYIDTLQNAQVTKERIYKMRKQEEENRETAEDVRKLMGDGPLE
ncbi:PH and SEC7 domain-containing protein [Cyphellophora attinorum]|uniref:PH and SEC7 domain-containing protein n=1 Tax=Cyphellophora attinorum TaxID=1664694 RepID=A0A0N1P1Z6_9EURO|nr:PH and SEC7 domain-containing protein [Phialophora attinorum]KPI44394.1 PH and SEC7 domain-containing protein [Phialophora attinorum]